MSTLAEQSESAPPGFEGATRTFWYPGIIAFVLATLAIRLDWLARLPFVNELIQRPGAAGLIAASVLTIAVWVIVAVLIRSWRSRREMTVVRRVREVAVRVPGLTLSSADQVLASRITDLPYESSMIRRRLHLLRHGQQSADAEAAVASQSGLDAAHSEATFGPVRALVWSLPALGFLGTATEMSHAVGGLGAAVAGTASYNDLRNFLVQRVIPPLADAFDITLFALGSTVVCYLLLSLVHTREQRTLLEADAASLELLATIAPPSPARISLNGDMDALAREVASFNQAVTESNRLLKTVSAGGGLGQIAQILLAMDGRLERILMELGQDFVIRRQPSSSQSGSQRD